MLGQDFKLVDWVKLLSEYPKTGLQHMWQRLSPDLSPPSTKPELVEALAAIHLDGSQVETHFETTSTNDRLAVRLALDGSLSVDSGLPTHVLHNQLNRIIGKGADQVLTLLIKAGCLLLLRRFSYSNLDYKDMRSVNTALMPHPILLEAAAQIPVPGEELRLGGNIRGQVRGSHGFSPERVVDGLKAVCRVVDGQPKLVTKQGRLRVAAQRMVSAETVFGEGLVFDSWFQIAQKVGLIVFDGSFCKCTAEASLLETQPLAVLSRIPAAVCKIGSNKLCCVGDKRAGRFYHNLIEEYGPSITRAVVDVLSFAATSDTGRVWIGDGELAPLVARLSRMWEAERLSKGFNWWMHYDFDHIKTEISAEIGNQLDVLAALAIIDRGTIGKTRASRLTVLGTWLLNQEARITIDAKWLKDGRLAVKDPDDIQLFGLLLGTLGERVDWDKAQGFKVDAETIARTLRAGEPVASVLKRLERLVLKTPPASVLAAFKQASKGWQPAEIFPEIIGVHLDQLPTKLRAVLKEQAVAESADTVYCSAEIFAEIAEKFKIGSGSSFDYDEAPHRRCTVKKNMQVAVGDGAKDLRWVQLSEEMGVAGRASFPLDLEAIPGLDKLDDRALDRRVRELLGRLDRHVQKGLNDATMVRLLAAAGLVPAPEVGQYVVLEFPESSARGLSALKVLGDQVEMFSGNRFLVPRSALAEVEEKLSQFGIPFPAEHSSLHETGRVEAAVGRLEKALSTAADTATPAARTEPPAPPKSPPRQPDDPELGLSEKVLLVVGKASKKGGRGAVLGTIAQATGADRKVIKPILRDLIDNGTIALSGHARGARYRMC